MNEIFAGLTKAGVLKKLQKMLTSAKVLPQLVITHEQFRRDQESVIKMIRASFSESHLIFRSSSREEDQESQSAAGKYESVLYINKDRPVAVVQAIEKVFASYECSDGQEVLVQPMLERLKYSGVLFTCNIDTLAPYYVINYHEGADSSAITGGKASESKIFVQYKNAADSIGQTAAKEKFIQKLITAANEIEGLFESAYLDIEFGVNQEDDIYIFQARPVVRKGKHDFSGLNLDLVLYKIYRKVEKRAVPHPNLLGDKAFFGVMPDWNPAEIIGLRPKKLALSLYKELVTDYIWAVQRKDYGYRDLQSHPLLVTFLGIPYIDVRLSLNSFVPRDLEDSTANKLINFYLEKLEKYPVLHDKIEFEIVYSCYYFGIEGKLSELESRGFTAGEITQIIQSLRSLTNYILDPDHMLYQCEIDKTGELEAEYRLIMRSGLSTIDKIYWLMEVCKKLGTLPFAGVARCAFVATQILRSLVEVNVITDQEREQYLRSISTVNKQLNQDFAQMTAGLIDKEAFLKLYGHIRPGTYDILSPNYQEAFDCYFSAKSIEQEEEQEAFDFSAAQLKQMDAQLAENGLNLTGEQLVRFMSGSIEGREHTKFVFTKCINAILELLKKLADRTEISYEEMAHLDIQRVKELYSGLDFRDVADVCKADIEVNQKLFHYTNAIMLPSIITTPEQVYGYYLLSEEPNFITLHKAKAEVIVLVPNKIQDMEDKIIFIESADPGYDFIFSKGIAGLITKFGGANSHMAIRCAEYGIPAVIGAGEQNFNRWKTSKIIEIDSQNKVVSVIA